jgi:hypothetical protein
LNAGGITNIQTAAQAAAALKPLAGEFAFLLFALGIIGTGLLAIPVLAGSAAYGVAEAFGWPATLEAKAPDAVGFYGNDHWFRTRIHEYQPDQNADLERRLKRHCCRTDHDRHGGYYFQEKLDGTF